MGYDPADTDPYDALRRQMQADTAAARAALGTSGTQPFQTVRKVLGLLEDLLALVARLPQVESRQDVKTGFGLEAGWQTVAAVTLPRPTDKNRVVVQASAQGTVLDTTSGGLTTTQCRILIGGVASAVIPAAKDAGASAVQNVLVVSSTREITPLPGAVAVEFQINPLNPAAYPAHVSNIANLSVYAGYSVV